MTELNEVLAQIGMVAIAATAWRLVSERLDARVRLPEARVVRMATHAPGCQHLCGWCYRCR